MTMTPTVDSMQYQCSGPAAVPAHAARIRRRVSFKPSVTVQPIDRLSRTAEDKSRLYYSKDEMDQFGLEVKAIRTLSKDLPPATSPCGAHLSNGDCVIGLEADPALRGLELHLCPIRVRNKLLASRAIIKYHDALRSDASKTDEERTVCLASACSKLGAWSRHVALETGRLDSIRARDEEYVIPVSEPVDIAPFPITATKRRRVTCDGDECRPAKRMR